MELSAMMAEALAKSLNEAERLLAAEVDAGTVGRVGIAESRIREARQILESVLYSNGYALAYDTGMVNVQIVRIK